MYRPVERHTPDCDAWIGEPLVGILLTVGPKERQDWLDQAIQSVWDQTYPNVRLHCWLDGAEPDQVLHHCDDPRFELVGSERIGRWPAMQRTLEDADCDLIGWVDADDWLSPYAVANALGAIGDDPKIIGSCSDHVEVYEDGGQKKIKKAPCSGPADFHRAYPVYQFKLLRSSAVRDAGGFDVTLDYAGDWDISRRVSMLGSYAHARSVDYFRRIRANSYGHRGRPEQWRTVVGHKP